MTTLRCSQKLLKRLRLDARTLPELPPSTNPLGEWCADIDFIDREPHALLMNAATGTMLVLPARAADLKRLHAIASTQLAGLLELLGVDGPLAQAELDALAQPFAFARNGNRSLVASMNRRKFEVWSQFAYNRLNAFEVALRELESPFTRKELGREYHYAADLLRRHLLPSAKILPFVMPETRQ